MACQLPTGTRKTQAGFAPAYPDLQGQAPNYSATASDWSIRGANTGRSVENARHVGPPANVSGYLFLADRDSFSLGR